MKVTIIPLYCKDCNNDAFKIEKNNIVCSKCNSINIEKKVEEIKRCQE